MTNNIRPLPHHHVDRETAASSEDQVLSASLISVTGGSAFRSIASGMHATCEEYDDSASSSQWGVFTPESHTDTLDARAPNSSPTAVRPGSNWSNCGADGYSESFSIPAHSPNSSPMTYIGNPVSAPYLVNIPQSIRAFDPSSSGHFVFSNGVTYNTQNEVLAANAYATDEVAAENTEWCLMHNRERITWRRRIGELEKAIAASEKRVSETQKANRDLQEQIAKLKHGRPADVELRLQSVLNTQKLQSTSISAVLGRAEAVEKLVYVSTESLDKDITAMEKLNVEQAQKIEELKVGFKASELAKTSLQEKLEAVDMELNAVKATTKRLQADANGAKKRAEQHALAHDAALEQVRDEVGDLTKHADETVATMDSRAVAIDARFGELEARIQSKNPSKGKWDSKVLPDGNDGPCAAIKEVKDDIRAHDICHGHLEDELDALKKKLDTAEISKHNKIDRVKVEHNQMMVDIECDPHGKDVPIRQLQYNLNTMEKSLTQKIDSGLGDIRKDRDLHAGKIRDLEIAVADLRQDFIQQNQKMMLLNARVGQTKGNDGSTSIGDAARRVDELSIRLSQALGMRDMKISDLSTHVNKNTTSLKTFEEQHADTKEKLDTLADAQAKKIESALSELRDDQARKILSIDSRIDTLRQEFTSPCMTQDASTAKPKNNFAIAVHRSDDQAAMTRDFIHGLHDLNTRVDEAIASRDQQMGFMSDRIDNVAATLKNRVDENAATLKTTTQQHAKLKDKLAGLEGRIEAAATMEYIRPLLRAASEAAEAANREMVRGIDQEIKSNSEIKGVSKRVDEIEKWVSLESIQRQLEDGGCDAAVAESGAGDTGSDGWRISSGDGWSTSAGEGQGYSRDGSSIDEW